MQTTTELKVDGMSCGSCVAAVTKALARVPGVQEVQVDLARGVARVSAENAVALVPAMLSVLAQAGYVADAMPGTGDTGAAAPRATQTCGSAKGSGGCCCR